MLYNGILFTLKNRSSCHLWQYGRPKNMLSEINQLQENRCCVIVLKLIEAEYSLAEWGGQWELLAGYDAAVAPAEGLWHL